VKNKLCFILCQDKAFEDKINCQFQRVRDKVTKLHTLTDQTTNSIFDSFRTDIGDRQAFLDEVARSKTRLNMVDGQKPQTLLETLNVTNQDVYPNIYAIFTVLITMPVSSASSERTFSAMRRHKCKMYERNIPGNIQRIKFQSSCKHMQPSCTATRTGN
jgi:hypothetical protein